MLAAPARQARGCRRQTPMVASVARAADGLVCTGPWTPCFRAPARCAALASPRHPASHRGPGPANSTPRGTTGGQPTRLNGGRGPQHARQPESAGTAPRPITVPQVLTRLRRALCTHSSAVQSHEMVAQGIGRHLGINIQWRIQWRADGAFREEVTGKELEFQWGYDGRPGSCCWEMDSSGVARGLECDDHEALLVAAWVRTGLWLQPSLTSRMDIQILRHSPAPPMQTSYAPGGAHGDAQGGNGARSAQLEPGTLTLVVRLKGGKLENHVRVCPNTWAVLGLDQPLCGDTEVWQFGAWTAWHPGLLFPEHASHQAIAGGHHVYLAESCVAIPLSPMSHFQCPDTPILPADTSFMPGVPPELPVWRAGSGHLLVRPRINGREGGYMVVDTGASGFVITPAAAADLGLDPFGELFAASISGKVPAQFVKARSWALGPLAISGPVMMTMPVDGLVKGAPPGGEVIGIVGYDIFRRAVIELPQMLPPASGPDVEVTSDVWRTAKQPSSPAMAPATQQVPEPRPFSPSPPASLPAASAARSIQRVGSAREGAEQFAVAAARVLAGSRLAESGPLPFLRGLLSAASAALVGGTWGPQRTTTIPMMVPEPSETDNPPPIPTSPFSPPGPAAEGHGKPGAPLGVQAGPGQSGAGVLGRSGQANNPGGWQQFTMRLYPPDQYGAELEAKWSWQPFKMIASLPHLDVRFLGADGAPLDVLLMLDSGACGADIMLHARAMHELDLQRISRPTSHFVRGVGGASSDNSVRVELVDLAWVELAGMRFKQVKCMYAGVGGLDISLHSSGILCGDMLTRLPTVFDYARKRIGFRFEP